MSMPSSPQEEKLINTLVSEPNEVVSNLYPLMQDDVIFQENNKRKLEENSSESGDETFTDGNKKKRLNWSQTLHQKFVDAVNKLGDKGRFYIFKFSIQAVPKKILKEMNVDGLTRENVASHLQV